MNSSINMQFAWADFYSEFADKLLQFKNNRTELLSILEETYDELGLNYPFVEKSRERVMCALTVFGCFNKGITNENRIMIMKTLGQNWVLIIFFFVRCCPLVAGYQCLIM